MPAMKGEDQEPVLSLSKDNGKISLSHSLVIKAEKRLVELMGFEPTTF